MNRALRDMSTERPTEKEKPTKQTEKQWAVREKTNEEMGTNGRKSKADATISYQASGPTIPSCRGSFGHRVFPGFAHHLPFDPFQISLVENIVL